MIHEILTALLYDVLAKIKANVNFFSAPEGERKKLLIVSPFLPESLVNYLSGVSETQFITDVQNLISFLNESSLTAGQLQGKLFLHLSDFCAKDLASYIDAGNLEIATEGAYGEAIREALLRYSYQEATDSIDRFLRVIRNETPVIVVQSARPVPGNVRSLIREELQKKYPHSIPVFSINTDLLGGIRLFVNGNVHDASWRSKINQLTSL